MQHPWRDRRGLHGLRPDPLRMISSPLRLVPDRVHEAALACAFNQVMWAHRLGSVLAPLEGTRVDLVVADTGNQWRLTVRHGRLAPSPRDAPARVTIRGTAADFVALAIGAEDPDTLFFARRLALEGETETGLELKNILDSLELDWPAALERAMGPRAAGALASLAGRIGITDLAGALQRDLIDRCRAADDAPARPGSKAAAEGPSRPPAR